MSLKKAQFISGGKIIVKILEDHKVKYVFGLIGSATMELFDSLYNNKKIKFIDVKDERTGTHIADGYARASGKPGVIIAGQNGPGVTNLVTGIAQSYKAFSPVISLGGDTSSDHKGKDSFQEIDQDNLFIPITKKTFRINNILKIPQIFNDAFKLALSPRCGPIHINLPRNILSEKIFFKKYKKNIRYEINPPSRKKIKKIIKILIKYPKTIIIAGAGIKHSKKGRNEVCKLAKILNVPIVTSAGHGDIINYKEKLYLGQMGPRGNKVATKAVKDANLILALGTRLGFNSTFYSNKNINKKSKIIQIDIEKIALGRYFPVELSLCTDATTFTEIISKELLKIKDKDKNKDNKWTNNFILERKKFLFDRDANANMNSKPIFPSGIFKVLREILPSNSAITLDAGTLCLQATDMLNYSNSRSLFTPLDFGLVGFSFACGLGVKLAKPNSPVISLMGDGGFGMTVSEITTAVKYKINTITIIMNNNSWGAEKAYQRDYYNKRFIGTNLKNPPFHRIARLYGAIGFKVNKLSDLRIKLKKALKIKKPVIINVDVDPNSIYSFRKDSFEHKK
ncbi:MAG: Sulfoacetaldehyde acetyltransferase [Alphaproteobacteria bacterium MarineAlpha5_Bin9]|nr:MAG: Sulfoacetaldehyde acetyltransferase [Alphaproteobacteria bacterium MarineAlpha5_Bin9]|tara:strand:- start:15972 stop:17672 length:1701 start_codon:yes stop_codon:yes gene_type:complete